MSRVREWKQSGEDIWFKLLLVRMTLLAVREEQGKHEI
jgi:hypothetical protein